MEMLPAALVAEGRRRQCWLRNVYRAALLGYFGLDRPLPHAHLQDLACKQQRSLYPALIKRYRDFVNARHQPAITFPEGIATFVTASSNLELGFGIALAVAITAQYS